MQRDLMMELLPRVRAGDRESWETLLRELRGRFLRMLESRGVDPHLAEDVVQESLDIVWRRIGTLRDPSRLQAWFTSILLNRLRNQVVRRRPEGADPEEVVLRGRDPLQKLIDEEGLRWVATRLRDLPPLQRRPVELRLVAGLSPEKVCSELGISRPCLRRRLHEGLKRLRERAAAWVRRDEHDL